MTDIDRQQRLRAIDITRSCIVQAPAGSGKTELLIQRMLALLGTVDQPQQILAITFTNKAAAEMRRRLQEALTQASTQEQPQQDHAALTWRLAEQALKRHGEALLQNPAQLAIQTIDSFCATIVRKMPWTTGFGAMPDISDDATELYEAAVQQLVDLLEEQGPVGDALQVLLRHLDNNMTVVQKMLVTLLEKRDQWLRHLTVDHGQLRKVLDNGLERICNERLLQVKQLIPTSLVDELLFCADVAARHCPEGVSVSACRDYAGLPAATMDQMPFWKGVAELLLTSSGTVRRAVNKNIGFPPGAQVKEAKERMTELLRQIDEHPQLVTALNRVSSLPRRLYDEQQWQLIAAIFDLLPRLVAELWLVFRACGKTDFIEVAMKANQALGAADDPSDLLLQLDHQLHHILVDEFQDTSRLQYQLFSTLTAGWVNGDGRTLFVVGDPMQSIYRFREAEVGLFLDSMAGTFGSAELSLDVLQLSCNFRSQQGLVEWANKAFSRIFPQRMDVTTGSVPLATAQAVKPLLDDRAVEIYPLATADDQLEAEQIVRLIQRAQGQDPNQTIAVLVRGRSHLRSLLPLLRQHGISYQSKDIELLASRPAVLDIVHLARALVHRGDRLAWVAVLRAPWCGLTLDDLTLVCAFPRDRTIPSMLADADVVNTLSTDGRCRAARTWSIVKQGMAARGQRPLRDLVAGCWLALGGPVGLSEAVLNDCELVFDLIAEMDQGGDLTNLDQLAAKLRKLYSPSDRRANGKLQIMTIHKAKGLQFDTVILPGLGKKTRRSEAPLLRWLEHPRHGLLLAPITERGAREKDPVYQLVTGIEAEKDDQENARLLYVAVTRAIRCLHLLGHASLGADDRPHPARGSLLEKLWPLVSDAFAVQSKDTSVAAADSDRNSQRRLSRHWKIPELMSITVTSPITESVASVVDAPDQADDLYSGWEKSLYRHVGTLVHRYLERIASVGVTVWSDEPDSRRTYIGQNLSRLGVRQADLDQATEMVLEAVNRTLSSERGQWLLSPHQQQTSELALSGYLHGQLVHAVIDRSFIDQGVRWVVDYKTAKPAPGEELEVFFDREAERYKQQMMIYLALIKEFDPIHEVKGALYFPLIDGWYEIH